MVLYREPRQLNNFDGILYQLRYWGFHTLFTNKFVWEFEDTKKLFSSKIQCLPCSDELQVLRGLHVVGRSTISDEGLAVRISVTPLSLFQLRFQGETSITPGFQKYAIENRFEISWFITEVTIVSVTPSQHDFRVLTKLWHAFSQKSDREP